jgi:hypothetical protein
MLFFKMFFYLEIYYDDIFYFFKFIFDIAYWNNLKILNK